MESDNYTRGHLNEIAALFKPAFLNQSLFTNSLKKILFVMSYDQSQHDHAFLALALLTGLNTNTPQTSFHSECDLIKIISVLFRPRNQATYQIRNTCTTDKCELYVLNVTDISVWGTRDIHLAENTCTPLARSEPNNSSKRV